MFTFPNNSLLWNVSNSDIRDSQKVEVMELKILRYTYLYIKNKSDHHYFLFILLK